MAIKRKKISKKRKNPDGGWSGWSLKSLFTSKGNKGDSISIMVTDGNIILTGKELPENYRTIFEILENKLKDLRIEFQPDGSKKVYVLNRPHDPKESREKTREMLSMSEYMTMPRMKQRRSE